MLTQLKDRLPIIGPWLHEWLLTAGFIAERKWTGLSETQYATYLTDDHPDREWFVQWVASQKPCSVLEIGPGGMHEARRLKALGHLGHVRYSVLDVASRFLAEGRNEFPEVIFTEGTINKIPFPPDTFDIVYCRSVLEHQPYYCKPIAEMFRVSRHFVVMNIFRWAQHRDIIRREKHYSNAYQITQLLAYVQSLCETSTAFIILKDAQLGTNSSTDPNIQRTRDHLVVMMSKTKDGANQILDAINLIPKLGIHHVTFSTSTEALGITTTTRSVLARFASRMEAKELSRQGFGESLAQC